jgi:hypothetical protein
MRLALVLAVMTSACAPTWKNTPHDRLFQVEPVAMLSRSPEPREPSDVWNKVELSLVRPFGKLISPGTYVRVLFGGPPADDVNRLGQVADSTWFENRIGRRDYTADEVYAGADTEPHVADGPIRVVSGKIDGVSPGFVVRDTAGQVWYLKLDHPAFPELSTSAETISSRLLWLAGYRVPAMDVVDVDVGRFELDPSATRRDHYNRPIPMVAGDLARLLSNTNPNARHQIRVLFSRQPPGTVLGPFSYRGKVGDDPNDTIVHEQRRTLRALWLFAAWLNNTDIRDANTLDMFRPITADGRGLVEHYLIDFGDSFGATGLGEKAAIEGWEFLVDWTTIVANLGSLGVRYPPYLGVDRSPFRAVGLFESKRFDPEQWRTAIPNPAFDQRTREDLFWAASILACIQPGHIRSAVQAGHYSEPGAAAFVVQTLLERRTKVLEYAFEGFVELDRPRVTGSTLRLDDLRVLGGLPPIDQIDYVVRWDRTRGFDRELASGNVHAAGATIAIDLGPALAAAKRQGLDEDPFLTVHLARSSGHLDVHLRVVGNRMIPIGVDR